MKSPAADTGVAYYSLNLGVDSVSIFNLEVPGLTQAILESGDWTFHLDTKISNLTWKWDTTGVQVPDSDVWQIPFVCQEGESARRPNATDSPIETGQIEISLTDSDYNPFCPGWALLVVAQA